MPCEPLTLTAGKEACLVGILSCDSECNGGHRDGRSIIHSRDAVGHSADDAKDFARCCFQDPVTSRVILECLNSPCSHDLPPSSGVDALVRCRAHTASASLLCKSESDRRML